MLVIPLPTANPTEFICSASDVIASLRAPVLRLRVHCRPPASSIHSSPPDFRQQDSGNCHTRRQLEEHRRPCMRCPQGGILAINQFVGGGALARMLLSACTPVATTHSRLKTGPQGPSGNHSIVGPWPHAPHSGLNAWLWDSECQWKGSS